MSSSTVVAAVTIGQSPRPDVMEEIAPLLGPGVQIVEIGALDGLTAGEIAAMAPDGDDHTMVTRLRDSSQVLVGRRHVLPRVQACIEQVQDQAALVMMLCTGTFPRFGTRRPVLYPEHLLFQMAGAVAPGGHLGILTPSARQIADQERRWSAVAPAVTVRPFSPYAPGDDLDAACGAFASAGVDLVVLDCLGYTASLKRHVKQQVGCPVLLARTVLARAAAELAAI